MGTTRASPVSRWAVAAVLLGSVAAGVGVIAVGVALSRPDVVARPAASDDGHRFWDRRADGSPVRWDPCRPIMFRVDDRLAPRYGGDLIDEAVAVLEMTTGLDFRRLADTRETPSLSRSLLDAEVDTPAWAPVLVTWAAPHEGGIPLRTSDRAVSIPVSVDGVFVTGQIVLNAERTDLEVVMGDRASSWGPTLVHELGHLVGLDHVDDESQLMSRFPGEGPPVFGAGDLAGLTQLGTDAGPCLDAGEPRETVVNTEPRT